MAPATPARPERTTVGGSLEIPRILNGLWQLAGGHDKDIDIASASAAMDALVDSGLECFDMADHYGAAELVVGHHNARSTAKTTTAFTKWCPAENGIKTLEAAEAAVGLALERLGLGQIPLMQYHIWDYSDDTYIHNLTHLTSLQARGKIAHLGLTNTDAAHLEMLLDSGFNIATNQVSCSVIDRRAVRGRLSNLCLSRGVGLLCYGTLLGGFISEKWLGEPEPDDTSALNWSLKKYLRFIQAAGGWAAFQGVLGALSTVARGIPEWEQGYARAVRVGSQIHVSGTTANSPVPTLSRVGGSSAASQTVWVLDIIDGALKALGSSMQDLVRTRIILSSRKDAEAVSEAHGWKMKCAGILPANTLIEATLYEDGFLVEIEAWAQVGSGAQGTLRVDKY